MPRCRPAAFCRVLAALWGCSLVASALAQPAEDLTQLSLEELTEVRVYSASKFVQKVSEAPSNVTVITAADIKTFGYRKLIDILNSIPGLYTTYDRNYDFLGVRGFQRPGDFNSRVLLLMDGIRLNENVYGQATLGTEFILDVDLIDRVEFVPGPGSSIYGNDAFFGVINVITKHGHDLKGAEASAEAATAATTKERMSFGRRFDNGVEWIGSATHYDSKGKDLFFPEYETPGYGNGVAHHLDYDRYDSVFSKASLAGFTVEAAYSDRKKGIPTGAYGTLFGDPRSYSVDGQSLVDVHYSGPVAEKVDFLARAYYRQYWYDGRFPYQDPSSGAVIENLDGSRGKWAGAELKIVQTGFERHKLVYGVEYQSNVEQRQFNYDNQPYFSYQDSRPTSQSYGAYLQDEFALRDNLVVNAGARYDRGSNVPGIASPRVALIYSLTATSTLKLLYGSAFRAPNAWETDSALTDLWKGNPNLRPERIKTYEAIFEHYFAKNLRLNASVFSYRIRDLISQTVDPVDGLLFFDNLNKAEALGGQLVAEGQWDNGLRARASYSFQRTRDSATGAMLTNSPVHLAKLNVSTPTLFAGVRAGVEMLYTGARKSTLGEVPAYSVTNLTLRTEELMKGLDLSLSAYNVFDKKYFDPTTVDLANNGLDSLQQDGRSFRFKLTYRF